MAGFEHQAERPRQPPQSQDDEQAVPPGRLPDRERWERAAGPVEPGDV